MSPSTVTLALLEYRVNVTLTPIHVRSNVTLAAGNAHPHDWEGSIDANEVGESRGEAGGQALASGSRGTARRRHGDARLRRRLDELGSITGASLLARPLAALDPDGRAWVLGAHGSKGEPLLLRRSQPALIPGLVCPGPCLRPGPGKPAGDGWKHLGSQARLHYRRERPNTIASVPLAVPGPDPIGTSPLSLHRPFWPL